MKQLATKLGASYVWGLVNFATGVACGSFGYNFLVNGGVASASVALGKAIFERLV